MIHKLGEELKEARLQSGLSLQQLAAKSRIDLKFLEALENGNFSFLPELYVKAFLKEYARLVGLNDEKTIKKYEAARLGKLYEEKLPAEEKPVPAPEENREEQKPVKKYSRPLQSYDAVPPSLPPDENAISEKRKKVMLIGVIAGTIVVIASLYFIFFSSRSEIIVPEKPIDEVIEENNERFVDDEPVDSGTNASFNTAGDSLKLNIRTTDTSWVKIILDDKRVEEFILFPNAYKTIAAADNYKITFGKASAVRLTLNDKPLTFNPGLSKVFHVLINSSGITALEAPPNFTQE